MNSFCLKANSTHWIHQDKKTFRSTPEDPIFGHVVERFWTVLFNCSNPKLAAQCRQKKCACFD
jgi:hypothetical protein